MIDQRGRDVLALWIARGLVVAIGIVGLAATAGIALRVFDIASG